MQRLSRWSWLAPLFLLGCSSEESASPQQLLPVEDSGGDSSLVPDQESAPEAANEPIEDAGQEEAAPPLVVWPNASSKANSDPWIAEHHAEIQEMRPKLLAINFVNQRSMAAMHKALQEEIDLVAESTRYHGYADPAAPPFIRYELAYEIDLRDPVPPDNWPYNNSSLYPREEPQKGQWGFDYEKLFTQEFADLMKIADPENPSHNLRLCELIDRGLVHEVWLYGDADVPDVGAAEMLEYKPYYDENRQRYGIDLDRCAGNGCFDYVDNIPEECTRTVRIGWFNNTRGPGCYLESLSHSFETLGKGVQVPYMGLYFPTFANLNLSTTYGAPVKSWYSCEYGVPCLTYPDQTTVQYDLGAKGSGTIENYNPVCGNVHFLPNGRQHYDLTGPDTVLTTCETWRQPDEQKRPFTTEAFSPYKKLGADCMGAFLVWWRQNMPGRDNKALDDDGKPMLNWWPFIYY